jgi:cobalt-zinc-cadmium resistance protein CzcA
VIARIVRFVLGVPAIMLVLAGMIVALGLTCYRPARHRGLPEPGAADDRGDHAADGWSAEEVERYVTIPLETGLTACSTSTTSARSRCSACRTSSATSPGTSSTTRAEQRVLNRLQLVTLPPGCTPQLSPWSAIGEVYRYVVRGTATRSPT